MSLWQWQWKKEEVLDESGELQHLRRLETDIQRLDKAVEIAAAIAAYHENARERSVLASVQTLMNVGAIPQCNAPLYSQEEQEILFRIGRSCESRCANIENVKEKSLFLREAYQLYSLLAKQDYGSVQVQLGLRLFGDSRFSSFYSGRTGKIG